MNNNSETSSIDLMIVDWHGNLRGKNLPSSLRDKVMSNVTRVPLSTQIQDIWGNDNDEITGLALSVGDPDGVCVVEPRTLGVQPWSLQTEQVLSSMYTLSGEPYFGDSREILRNVLAQFNEMGLTPVVAVELEFYLLDAEAYAKGIAKPPAQVLSEHDPKGSMQLYDFKTMDRMRPALRRVLEYAKALELPAETTLAEFGPGQFEINLAHRNDALHATDDAILFKRCVDCAARDSNLAATFMAKPYAQHGGNGMHVHVSLLDKDGRNIFDEPGDTPTQLLYATAGLLDTLKCLQLVFAPNANSYRRLQPESYAPINVNWGYDHRGVAVRLPATKGSAARLEHRVSGADANPYLVMAGILGGVLDGLNKQQLPTQTPVVPSDNPAEQTEALTEQPEKLTHDWISAIDAWENSEHAGRIFGKQFQKVFAEVKRFEAATINSQVSNVDLQTYLTRL